MNNNKIRRREYEIRSHLTTIDGLNKIISELILERQPHLDAHKATEKVVKSFNSTIWQKKQSKATIQQMVHDLRSLLPKVSEFCIFCDHCCDIDEIITFLHSTL